MSSLYLYANPRDEFIAGGVSVTALVVLNKTGYLTPRPHFNDLHTIDLELNKLYEAGHIDFEQKFIYSERLNVEGYRLAVQSTVNYVTAKLLARHRVTESYRWSDTIAPTHHLCNRETRESNGMFMCRCLNKLRRETYIKRLSSLNAPYHNLDINYGKLNNNHFRAILKYGITIEHHTRELLRQFPNYWARSIENLEEDTLCFYNYLKTPPSWWYSLTTESFESYIKPTRLKRLRIIIEGNTTWVQDTLKS